jgi:hypothetical protein
MVQASTISKPNSKAMIEKALGKLSLEDLLELQRLMGEVQLSLSQLLQWKGHGYNHWLVTLSDDINAVNQFNSGVDEILNEDCLLKDASQLSKKRSPCANNSMDSKALYRDLNSFRAFQQLDKLISTKICSDKADKLTKAQLFLLHRTEDAFDNAEAFAYLASRNIEYDSKRTASSDVWNSRSFANPSDLRAAEMCDEPGIERACDAYFQGLCGSLEAKGTLISAASSLFDFCRVKHIAERLGTHLTNHDIAYMVYLSKVFHEAVDQEEGWSPIIAASAIFAVQATQHTEVPTETLENKLKDLMTWQSCDGGWPYSEKTSNVLSVYSTAIAIHALAVLKPSGWKQPAKDAADWLKAQWTDLGVWKDRHTEKRDTYLTVLALDAINLADGSNEVTFQHNNSPVRYLNIEHLLHRKETQQTEQSKKRGPDPMYTDAEYEKVLKSLVKFYDDKKNIGIAWQKAAKENDIPRGNPTSKGAETQTRRYCERKGLPMPTILWVQSQIKNKRKTSGN